MPRDLPPGSKLSDSWVSWSPVEKAREGLSLL